MLLETHCHTYLGSACGKLSPQTLVNLFFKKGYGGMVITEHFNKGIYDEILKENGYTGAIDLFLRSYNILKQYTQNINFKVFLGMEINTYDENTTEEYLIYGFDTNFLYDNPKLLGIKQIDLFTLCNKYGFLMIQSHPLRHYITLGDFNYMHGIEVYNGNLRHDSNNKQALKLGKEKKVKMLSGSDFHEEEDLHHGGIFIPDEIETNKQLVEYLFNNQPDILYNSKRKQL